MAEKSLSSKNTWTYHVALSFAGEDRQYVDKVANILRERGLRVFYDKYEEAYLWGKDLYVHLSDIYRLKAYFTLMFISSTYATKLWTNHERQNAQARAFEESREYVLPARFDDTEIPGLPKTIGYIDLRSRQPHDLARLVVEKLADHGLIRDNILVEADLNQTARILFDSLKRYSPDAAMFPDNLTDYCVRTSTFYFDYCYSRYKNMRILAMPKPVELSHIFTQLCVADRIRGHQSTKETEIIEQILSSRGQVVSGIDATSLFDNIGKVVILGRPGSGKSTLLKYMLLRELKSTKVTQLPILVPLNELDRQTRSLRSTAAAVLSQSGIENAEILLAALLKSGHARLLIDGLDELRVDDRRLVVDEIKSLINEHRLCSFIITGRTAAYEYWFGDCEHYEVQRFTPDAIKNFIQKWFSSDEPKARELVPQVLSNNRIIDLCSSPLMLTIVCIGFESGVSLSNNRAEIYKDAVDALLRKWDASRSIYRDDIYKSLTPKRREDLLSDLAARTFVRDQIAIPNAMAKEIVKKFIDAMPESAEFSANENDEEVVLSAIEIQHGLIEQRSVEYWAYAHLTFQEYLVARYLVSRDPDLRSKIVRSYVDKPEWREVIMLTATLLPNADDFVLDILKSLTKIGYGQYFVKQVERLINGAKLSVEHRRFRNEDIFFDLDESHRKRFTSTFLGVIEGGYRLTLHEIQKALELFRSSCGARGAIPVFEDIIRPRNDYDYIFYNLQEENIIWEEIGAELSEDSLDRHRVKLLERLGPRITVMIGEELAKREGFELKDYVRTMTSLLKWFPTFGAENDFIPVKLTQLFDPNNLFSLTSRKYMYVVPDCLPVCISEASRIMDDIVFEKTERCIKRLGLLESGAISFEDLKSATQECIKRAVVERIEATSWKNKHDSNKLRAFIAGDTLAEILLSQAFLTPIVRDAAVRTLNNMIENIPPTPDGPPPLPSGVEKGRAVRTG